MISQTVSHYRILKISDRVSMHVVHQGLRYGQARFVADNFPEGEGYKNHGQSPWFGNNYNMTIP